MARSKKIVGYSVVGFGKKLGEVTDRRRVLNAAAAVALSGWVAGAASAATQNSIWTNTVGDNLWSTAGNWNPNGVPNNNTNGFSDYNVSIGTPAPTVLTISPTIDNLTLTTGGVLNIQYSSTLTVNGPTLNNNGSVVINSNQGNALAELAFGGNTALTGAGNILLQQPGSNAQLVSAAGVTVTQGASHTIAGYGQLNLALVNNGLVSANVSGQSLSIGTYNISNNAFLQATGGANLSINGIQVTQGTSGLISAANASSTSLNNTTVIGGTFATSGTGTIQIGGTSTLTNATNNGVIDIHYGNVLNITNNLIDNGSVVVNSSSENAAAVLNFTGVTLTGTGAVTLQQPSTNAQLNGSLTQAVNHTIQGYGQVNAALINNGTVNANINGQTLSLQTSAMTNNSLFEATNGGGLSINGINVTQGAAGQLLAATGSTIGLSNTNITGGTLNSVGTGTFQVGGITTLTSVINNGVIAIPYPSTLNITGNLTDNGTIFVNSTSQTAVATLNFSGGTVTGAGAIILQEPGSNAQLNGVLTQGAAHTISGYGQIDATLTNAGTVTTNSVGNVLYIESPVIRNTGLMQATAGTLYFDNQVQVNNSGGTILASGGNVALTNGTSITGGTLTAVAPNVIYLNTFNSSSGYSANLTNVTLSAGTELDIRYPQVLSITGTTLTNNGLVVINNTQDTAVAQMIFNSNTLLTGSGTIRLQEPGSNAQLATGTGDTVTQDIHHTITGYGEITASLINNNLVNANVYGQTLYLDTNNKTNNLTLQASSGATMAINGITIAQGASGQILASANSAVQLTNSNISGGTLNSTGSGFFQINGSDTFISLTNNAVVNIPFNQVLTVNGNLANSGTIVVNSNTGTAVAALNFSGGTLSGTGSIVLQEPNNNAQINGTFTQSAGHTIQGFGLINAALTNNGLVNANVYGQTLILAGPITNNSLIEATGSAGINITGITVTQGAAGQIISATGTGISLTNSNIAGGTITGGGTFTVQGISALTGGVTSSTTINIPYNQQLNVTGGLTDNGTIVVNSNTGAAVAALNFSGGTLAGSGVILLQQGGNNAQIDGVFTQAATHSIQGFGQINALLTNNGIINSNTFNQTLTLASALTNNNLIEVTTAGAGLNINGITITQGAAGQISAVNGAGVGLNGTTIIGGSINGPGIYTVSGTATLTNVTSSAPINVPYNQLLNINGNLVDNGNIYVNNNQGTAIAELNFSGGTLSGTGTVFLEQPGTYAQIDGNFTQAAGHTIQGFGEITGTFNNAGTVLANNPGQSLYLLGSTTNSGRFQASSGATLNIAAGLLTNLSGTTLTGGSYEADANSTIALTGTVITNAATIILGGNNATFTAIAPLAVNSGTFTLKNDAVFTTVGNLSNSGTINTSVAVPANAVPPGSLTINGNFNQSAGATNDNGAITVTGSTSITGGVVTVGYGGTFTGTPITVGTGAQLLANGSLTSNPAVTDNGIFTFGPNANTGILTRTLSSLTIGSGAVATVGAASNTSNRTLLITPALNIAGATNASTGKLDLNNNDLDLPNASLATVFNQIKQGYNNGTFQGAAGITSTSAANDSRHLTALGVIQNNQGGTSLFTSSHLFDGTTPAAADVLVKYTYYGDTNLDGKVDGSDYTRIDNGYLTHLTGWFNGDFNYDGIVNGSDYTLIDNAFNTQAAQISTQLASPTASIADSSGAASVPEPTGALLVIPAIAFISRRRNKLQCVKK